MLGRVRIRPGQLARIRLHAWGGGARDCVGVREPPLLFFHGVKRRYLSSNAVRASSRSSERERFGVHWHFWNTMLALLPVGCLWYYLHFPVRQDMKEMAERQQANKDHVKDVVSNDANIDDNSRNSSEPQAQQDNNALANRIVQLEDQLDSLSKLVSTMGSRETDHIKTKKKEENCVEEKQRDALDVNIPTVGEVKKSVVVENKVESEETTNK